MISKKSNLKLVDLNLTYSELTNLNFYFFSVWAIFCSWKFIEILKKDAETVNNVFFGLIILIFVSGMVYRYFGKDKKIIKELMAVSNILEGGEENYSNINEAIEKLPSSMVKDTWKRYTKTIFHDESSGKRYHTVAPEYFFNFDGLYKDNMSYKFYTHLPQAILGLGMLGTFLGLSMGLSELELGNSDLIQKSATELLNGVKTAFYTSLFGLSYSILFSLFNNFHFSQIEKIISNIKSNTDKLFPLNKKERAMEEIIKNLQGIKASNNDMATVLSNQLDNMSKSFNENINNFSNTIESSNNGMTMALSNQLGNMSKSFNENIDNFSKIIESSNNNMATSLSDKLDNMSKSLNDNINNFSDTIGLNFKEELSENLNKIFTEDLMGKMELSLNQISDVFLTNSDKMQVFKNEMTESIGQLLELKNSYIDVIQETENMKSDFKNTLYGISDKMKDTHQEIEKMAENYKDIAEQTSQVTENLIGIQEKNHEILEKNVEVIELTDILFKKHQKIMETEKDVKELWESYEGTFKEINETLSRNMYDYKENLDITTKELKGIIRDNWASYEGTFKEINETLSRNMYDYKENLNITTRELEGIIRKNSDQYNTVIKKQTEEYTNIIEKQTGEYNTIIERHIEGYTNEMRKGLINLFRDYDGNLSNAIGTFNGVLLSFRENMDGMKILLEETRDIMEENKEILDNSAKEE